MRSDAKQGSIRLGSFFLSLQLPAARWWLSRPLSPRNRASSKEFLLLPAPRRRRWLGHCAKVNIYVAGAFLPLSFIFSPFLKCHRSAVFIIVQEMSFPLAGSLTPSCTEAAPLLPAPTSTRDLQWMASARREMDRARQAGTEQHNYSTILVVLRNPIAWSAGQPTIPGDMMLCLCLLGINIHNIIAQLPACMPLRKFRHISSLQLFLCSLDSCPLERLLNGLLSVGDFSAQQEIC